MNVLIVYAHQEEGSFNHAMKEQAVKELKELGHQVKVSDLYAMNFNAVAGRADFPGTSESEHINLIFEQQSANKNNSYSDDIKNEQDKVLWADTIIFQFPFWWASMPAILKGWMDRVLTAGFAWDFGKVYDQALLAGKTSMLSITTGGPANMYTEKGPNRDMHLLLDNIHHNILYFCGLKVLPPFIAYGVLSQENDLRIQYLNDHKERLHKLESTDPISFYSLDDYDENMQLKSNVKIKKLGKLDS